MKDCYEPFAVYWGIPENIINILETIERSMKVHHFGTTHQYTLGALYLMNNSKKGLDYFESFCSKRREIFEQYPDEQVAKDHYFATKQILQKVKEL